MQINWRKQVKLWAYILCICSFMRGAFFYLNIHQPLNLMNESGLSYTLQIEPGDTISRVTERLASQALLKHPSDLEFYARLSGKAKQIQVGEYTIELGTTGVALLELLISGEVNYHQIVIVEGWTLKQAIGVIQNNERVNNTLTDSQDLQTIFGTQNYPEGLFFPDTYNFTQGTSDQEILVRAQDLMTEVLAEEWAARAVGLPYSSPYEALIMASIVEKETALESEREAIAGVFVRRLEQGMRLQTDPTIIYGLGDNFDGNLTRANLRENTPYNTYTNAGLPPTPIALPGREAIAASLNPAEGDSLYFVAKGDGSHYFSATLKEHNAAVRQYQLNNR